jgi:sialic acid synthase SpsE
MIMSTGIGSVAEIDAAVSTARGNGCKHLVLLKCTSTYPAAACNTNILTIPHMRTLFRCEVGLSDHTMGIGVAVGAVALGATVVEKHFTLRRADGGVDSAFSMEPPEMASLVVETARVAEALGDISYGPTEKEKPSLQYRRSLYIGEDLRAGDLLTRKNLRIVRPGLGLPPQYFDLLVGSRVNQDVRKGTPLSWNLVIERIEDK